MSLGTRDGLASHSGEYVPAKSEISLGTLCAPEGLGSSGFSQMGQVMEESEICFGCLQNCESMKKE